MKAAAQVRKTEIPATSAERRADTAASLSWPACDRRAQATAGHGRGWPVMFSDLAAASCALVGVMVVTGWHAHALWLVQWEPEITPVAYTSGLCFWFAGAAVLAINHRRQALARWLCAPVTGISILTLASYLGSETLPRSLLGGAIADVLQHMAPNTALAFLLFGGGILASTLHQRPWRGSATAILGTLGGSLAATGFCGYAARLPAAYRWGSFRAMAPQAAVALMLLAASLVTSAWVGHRERRRVMPSWMPSVALLGTTSAALALWQAVRITHEYRLLPLLVLSFGVGTAFLLFSALRLGRKARLASEDIAHLNTELRLEVRRVRRAEEELRISQERLALALQAASAGDFDWNLQTNVNWWSRETEELYGVPAGQGGGPHQGGEELVLPEDLPTVHAAIQQALKTGEFTCEWRILRPSDGQLRWISARAKVLRDAAGQPLRMIGINLDITARKRAEALVSESEQRYRALIETTTQIVWTTLPNGEVAGDMPSWRRYTGMTEEELQGWGWIDSLHPDDRESAAAAWTAALQARSFYETEYRIRRQDGEYRHFWVRGVPVIDGQGQVREWVGTCSDISERKRAQDELRRQAALLDLAHDTIIVRDLHDRIQFWNRGAETSYGWTAAEALGQVTHQLLRTVFPEPLEAIEAKVKEAGEWEGELRHLTRQGAEIVLASRWSLQRDEQGNPLAVLEINRDITARKQADAELHRLNRALKTLSDGHSLILHAEEEGATLQRLCELIVGDGEYRLAWVGVPENDAGRSVRAVAKAGAGLAYLDQTFISWDASAASGGGPTGAAIRTRTPQVCAAILTDPRMQPWRESASRLGFRSSAVFPLVHAGVLFGALSIYSPEADAFGDSEVRLLGELADNVSFGIASLRARREREQMQKALQERTHDLESVNKELETFAYSVSHDLRAPLRSMDGFSQVLLEDYGERLDEPGKDCLRRVRAGCQNMGRLIDAILQLSRVTRSEVRLERVDISMLALAAAAMLQRTSPQRKVELHIASGLEAHTDRKLFQVALQNLLENAWKFTGQHPHARIDVGSLPSDSGRVFFVRDNGAGFDMHYAAKLFQPFQRLHAQEEFKGTGIGLATVQRTMQRLGGKAWAESSPGQGATFYIQLK